jgi:hypothetical protein
VVGFHGFIQGDRIPQNISPRITYSAQAAHLSRPTTRN